LSTINNNKKKILIISYFFAPMNEIGAIRVTKMANSLSKKGWDVEVLTSIPNKYQKHESTNDSTLIIEKNIKVTAVPFPIFLKAMYKLKSIIIGKHSTSKEKKIAQTDYEVKSPFLNYIAYLKIKIISYLLFVKARKKINKKNKYDLVLSSYGPIYTLYFSKFIKKHMNDVKYIQDLRDRIIYPNDYKNKYLYRYKVGLEKMVSVYSDMVLTVSLSALKQHKYISLFHNIEQITNGYNIEDIISRDKFFNDGFYHIYYGGRVYPDQDPGLLSKAILKTKYKDIIKIDYAGNQFIDFKSKFSPLLNNNIINHGFISRKDSLMHQQTSNMNLLLSWNSNGDEGVFTGKVFELLNANRPVTAIISGDKTNAVIEEMFIADENKKCFYYKNGEKDLLELVAFIEEQIDDYLVNGMKVLKKYNKELYKDFSYDVILERFHIVVNKLISEK